MFSHIKSFGFSMLFFSSVYSSELTDLANKYASDKGNQYACAHFYTKHYEKLFDHRRDEELNILEIGLNRDWRFDCASLRMWLDYFPFAHLIGIDIVPQTFNDKRVTILSGDQSNLEFLTECSEKLGQSLDIIIDDGSHASWDQQITLIALFKSLKPGGLYVIEDLHYQPWSEPKGVMKTREFISRIQKGLKVSISCVSTEHIKDLVENIESIEFYDSARYGEKCLAVIKKSFIE